MKRITSFALAVAGAAAVWGCGAPNTKGLQGETPVTVEKILDGESLALSTGRTLRLIGVDAPASGEALFQEARAGLEKLALSRPARLAHEGKSELVEGGDMLGHLFVQTEGGRWVWVEEVLLQEGLVRVRTRKDGAARAVALLAAEAVARDARRGVWADKTYAVKDAARNLERLTTIAEACSLRRRCARAQAADKSSAPSSMVKKTAAVGAPAASKPDAQACQAAADACRLEGFQVVEGRVRKVFVAKSGGLHLNFGDDYKTDFSVYVAPPDVQAWPGGLEALKALDGGRLRVRGMLEAFNGPSIRVDHAAAVEVLGAEK